MKPSIARVLCLAILLPALLSGCDFSADFTATFTGSCGDCTNQSFPITATR